eukprot:463827_1
MDLEIYSGILREGGINPNAYDSKKKRKYPNAERAFRHDIFKGKTIWTGNKKEDFKLFVASYHPLFGLFMVSEHHPYTHRKRFITLLMMLCVGAFWAALSVVLDTMHMSQNKNSKITYTDILKAKLIVSNINGTILALQELCLRHVLSCACRENTEGKRFNYLCKFITKCAVFLWFIIAMIALVGCIILVLIYKCFTVFCLVFILQFIFKWIFQIVGLYLKFRRGWNKDMKIMKNLKKYHNQVRISTLVKRSKFKLKDVLKIRREKKCPYYVTFEDSNYWIQQNPEYSLSKMNNCKNNKEQVLSTMMTNSNFDELDSDMDELSGSQSESDLSLTNNGEHDNVN